METTSNSKKTPVMLICPCPINKCKGTLNQKDGSRFHSTDDQIRACQTKYLLEQGYKRKSAREFINPESGRILVLCKKAARAKPGKAGRYMGRPAKVKVM